MPKKLTNEEIDKRLEGRNIQRLSPYINKDTKIYWKCINNNYHYEWMATPGNVLHNKSGCPECAGNLPLTNDIVDIRLIGRNIQRESDYIISNMEIRWKCLKAMCNHKWQATPDNVLNAGTGCPKCSGNIELTNDIVDNRLKNRDIRRISNIIKSSIKSYWQCLNELCGHEWKATPAHILDGRGCPKCAVGKNEKLVGKVLNNNGIPTEGQKYLKEINSQEISWKRVDIFLEAYNAIIEYNGAQHYRPVKYSSNMTTEISEKAFANQKARDCYIQWFCDTNGITLMWIDGRKYTNSKLEIYIKEYIIPQLKIVNKGIK